MALVTFDTLEYSKNLEAKGFTVEQAEALAIENKRVFNEFAENQLATKADLFVVKDEIKTELVRLDKDIVVMRWAIFTLLGLTTAAIVKYLFL